MALIQKMSSVRPVAGQLGLGAPPLWLADDLTAPAS